MKDFKSIFNFEIRRSFTSRNAIIIFMVMVISLLFLWEGVSVYKKAHSKKNLHAEMEQIKVKGHTFYTQYGTRGIQTIFLPPPLSILFNNTRIFHDLTAKVDTSEKLNIYNGMKGPHLFARWSFFDYSGLMYFVVLLLVLLYGYDATRNKETLKYLKRQYPGKNIFLLVIFSRAIIFSMAFVAFILLAFIFCLINGIALPFINIVWYFLPKELTLIFFLFTGSAIGFFQRARIYWLIGFYLLFLIFLPYLVGIITKINANNIPNIYDIEKEKYQLISKFEREGEKRIGGKYKRDGVAPPEIREYIKSYLENEYPLITKKEEKLVTEINSNINLFEMLSTPIPTCFQMALNYELSGSGYLEFVDFYRYNLSFKDKFFNFYINKHFFSPSKKIENFVKNDEYFYYSNSRLPSTFVLGIICTFLWTAGALFLGWIKFKKFFKKGKSGLYNEIAKIEPESKVVNYVLTKSQEIREQIFDYFSDFVYLPSPAVFGKSGFHLWKKAFYEALESDKPILADIDDIADNNPVINLTEISKSVEEKNAVFIAVGEDYFIYRYAAGNPILIEGDKSIVLNCIMDDRKVVRK
jgi:hypothetical protein